MGFLDALFKAAFADRPSILPRTYAACNLGIGVLLLLGSALVLANQTLGSILSALGMAAAGFALSAGWIMHRVRPQGLARTLAVHGVLLALVAIAVGVSSVRWALSASVPGSFRYLPGVILALSVYAALQLAEFGWPQNSRPIRLAGFWFGIAVELGVMAGFVVRLSNNH